MPLNDGDGPSTEPTVRPADHRLRARRWLIGLTVVCVFVSPLVPFVMMAGGMASDAGPSLKSSAIVFWGLACPFVIVGTPIVGWGLYAVKAYRAARWVIALPLAWVAYFFVAPVAIELLGSN